MHRRDLIKLSAGAALVAKAAAPHRFFTEAEYQVVDQLTEMIIPADDKSGGAKAARVADYIDARLAEAFLPEDRERWRTGLKPFVDASADQRGALLARIAASEKNPQTAEEHFFAVLNRRDHSGVLHFENRHPRRTGLQRQRVSERRLCRGAALKQRPHIAVVGSANIDLTTFTDIIPRPGETIFGREFNLGFGGKGANQAVAARLCGADVTMIARVGDDLFGEATIRNLESYGIDASHVRITPGVSSGVAPIFVDSSGQNRILVVKGANDRLTPADVDAAAEVLSRADVIVLQLEIPLETVYHTLRFARARDIPAILNPAPGQSIDIQEAANADYVVPNETEAEALGRNRRSRSRLGARMCANAAQSRIAARDHHFGRAGRVARVRRRNDACSAVRGSACRYLGCRRRVHRQPGLFPRGRNR